MVEIEIVGAFHNPCIDGGDHTWEKTDTAAERCTECFVQTLTVSPDRNDTDESGAAPICVSAEKFEAGLRAMGLWFNGNVFSVKLMNNPNDVVMFGCGKRQTWYAEVELPPVGGFGQSCAGPSRPYEMRIIRIPVHTGSGRDCSQDLIEPDCT